MQPIQVTVNGTGISTAFIMDYMQNPFQVSVACVMDAAGTYSVEHTFNYSTVFSPTWNGSTGVTWFPNTGIVNATAGTASGNYAFPVAAIRLNVSGAVATTVTTMFLTQASNAP